MFNKLKYKLLVWIQFFCKGSKNVENSLTDDFQQKSLS